MGRVVATTLWTLIEEVESMEAVRQLLMHGKVVGLKASWLRGRKVLDSMLLILLLGYGPLVDEGFTIVLCSYDQSFDLILDYRMRSSSKPARVEVLCDAVRRRKYGQRSHYSYHRAKTQVDSICSLENTTSR